jgi:hypothetical protein
MIQCWVKKADGLVLRRAHLERLISLERFKGKRMKWLELDLREFFPYQQPLYSGTPETLSKLLVSRFPFEQYSSDELKSPKEFIEDADGKRPRLAVFSLWTKPKAKSLESSADGLHSFFTDLVNYDERSLSAYLTLLAQGQIRVQTIPSLKKPPETGAA